jgi:hypothetical protein
MNAPSAAMNRPQKIFDLLDDAVSSAMRAPLVRMQARQDRLMPGQEMIKMPQLIFTLPVCGERLSNKFTSPRHFKMGER